MSAAVTSYCRSTKALASPPRPGDGTWNSGRIKAGAVRSAAGALRAHPRRSIPASRAAAAPASNPFSRHAARSNAPAAAPAARNPGGVLPGTKQARSASKSSLPPEWQCRWTQGFQPPETASRSQPIVRVEPPVAAPSSFRAETLAPATRRRPFTSTTAKPFRVSISCVAARAAAPSPASGRASTIAATDTPPSARSAATA